MTEGREEFEHFDEALWALREPAPPAEEVYSGRPSEIGELLEPRDLESARNRLKKIGRLVERAKTDDHDLSSLLQFEPDDEAPEDRTRQGRTASTALRHHERYAMALRKLQERYRAITDKSSDKREEMLIDLLSDMELDWKQIALIFLLHSCGWNLARTSAESWVSQHNAIRQRAKRLGLRSARSRNLQKQPT